VLLTHPDLFDNYILISPALVGDYNRVLEYEESYAAAHSEMKKMIFTALGGLNDENIIYPWKTFNQRLQERHYSGLTLIERKYEDQTHISVFPLAPTQGLKAVFTEKR